MEYTRKEAIAPAGLPGRTIFTAIGKSAVLHSDRFTLGYSRFTPDQGKAPAHAHAEEALIVMGAKGCVLRYGPSEGEMDGALMLEAGMVLHVGTGEWHSFELESDGYADFMFFYAAVDGLRPEDSGKKS